MTTDSKITNLEVAKSGSSVTDGYGDGFSGHLSGGNTALALVLINQLMELYTEIMQLQSTMACVQMNIQRLTGKAEADTALKSGQDQAYSDISKGVAQVVEAAGSAGANAYGRSSTKAMNEKITDEDKAVQPYRTLQKNVESNTPATVQGSTEEDIELQDMPSSQEVQDRIEQLKNKQYFTDLSKYDKEAIEHLNSNDATSLAKIRADLATEIETRETRLNTLESEITRSLNKYSQLGTTLSQLSGAGGQVASGIFLYDKATQDQLGTYARTTNSMAANGAQEALKNMGENYHKALEELKILQAINESQRVGY